MKYISAIILLLFSLTFTACENIEYIPFNNYNLKVKFIDDSGNKLLEDLEWGPYKDDISGEIYIPNQSFLNRNSYSLRYGEGIPENENQTLQYINIYDDKYLNLNYTIMDVRLSLVTYYLKCEQIFGDDLEHEIVAYHSRGNNPSHPKKVTFDGVEQTVYDGDLVTITVKRHNE